MFPTKVQNLIGKSAALVCCFKKDHTASNSLHISNKVCLCLCLSSAFHEFQTPVESTKSVKKSMKMTIKILISYHEKCGFTNTYHKYVNHLFCRYDSSCFHYILDEDQAWMAFYYFLQSWCPFWNGIWLGCPWQFTWSTYQKIGFCLHLVQFCLCSVSSQQVLFDWQLNINRFDTIKPVVN